MRQEGVGRRGRMRSRRVMACGVKENVSTLLPS